jgi:hypothetical protein
MRAAQGSALGQDIHIGTAGQVKRAAVLVSFWGRCITSMYIKATLEKVLQTHVSIRADNLKRCFVAVVVKESEQSAAQQLLGGGELMGKKYERKKRRLLAIL